MHSLLTLTSVFFRSGEKRIELPKVFRGAIGYQTPKEKEDAFRQQNNELEKAA